MNCAKTERILEEYLDGTLSEKNRAGFDSHLRKCPECRKLLLERQRLGGMLSGSLKKMAEKRALSPEAVKSILDNARKSRSRRTMPLILRPVFAVSVVLPLLVLGLLLVLFQSKDRKNHLFHSNGQKGSSYLKLTTTQYRETPSGRRLIKRTHIKRRNGEEGFLTLELTRDVTEKKET